MPKSRQWDRFIKDLPLNPQEFEFLEKNRDEVLRTLFSQLDRKERLVLTHLYGIGTHPLTIQEIHINYAPIHENGIHRGKRESTEWVRHHRSQGERKLRNLLLQYFYMRRLRLPVRIQIQLLTNTDGYFLDWRHTRVEMQAVAMVINRKPVSMSVMEMVYRGDAWSIHPIRDSSTKESDLLTVRDIVDEILPLLDGIDDTLDIPPFIQKIVDALTRSDLQIL